MRFSIVPFERLNRKQTDIIEDELTTRGKFGGRPDISEFLPSSKVLMHGKEPVAFVAVREYTFHTGRYIHLIKFIRKRACMDFRNKYARHPIIELLLHVRELFPNCVFPYRELTEPDGERFVKKLLKDNPDAKQKIYQPMLLPPYAGEIELPHLARLGAVLPFEQEKRKRPS